MSKYNEIMDKVTLSEKSEKRILENIETAPERKSKTVAFPKAKKILAAAAGFAFVAFVVSRVPFINGLGSKTAATETADGGAYGSYYVTDGMSAENNGILGIQDYNSAEKVTADYDGESDTDGEVTEKSDDKKIIYTADVELQVKNDDYNSAVADIKSKAAAMGGYIEGLNSYSYTYSSYTYITVRVPAENYREFLDSLSGYGTMSSVSESSEDVTYEYKDYASRLAGKIAERDRLTELLDEAENISDIIRIEDKLSEIQSDIEYYQGIIDSLDNRVSYCTVNIDIESDSSVTYEEPSFGEKIVSAAESGITIIVEFFEFIILFVAQYGLITVIIIGIVYAVYRFIKKRRNR